MVPFFAAISGIASAIYLGIERALARITTRIVAITPGQRAELTNLLAVPPGKVVEIPLGLDLDSFQNAPDQRTARERLALSADDPVVGIAGRLVPIKDVSTFLRAVTSLAKDFPNLTALVAGDGEERVALEREAVALGIAGRCQFLGWRADLATIFAAIDVLALSSLNEGTPVSVIEAMATGRPVVASAVGGVPYVVLHNRPGSWCIRVTPRRWLRRSGQFSATAISRHRSATRDAEKHSGDLRRHVSWTMSSVCTRI